ncbi:MAG TPA: MarR family transcriptional regulator, partial [Janthinobacterium sp.]|nr:MarR family transcriptional regulator [Janthinobacterium sp.]
MNTAERILFLLKTRGPQSAQQLATLLELTSMGARRQLEAALEKGYVSFDDVADKVGRPARRWLLTEAGHARFPDRHADLSLQLIEQVRALFGEAGMDQLIVAREQGSEALYRA